ncbi:hypothetical protein CRE_19887 [Caenorhabditis remanei]|uniref:Uncharacterized protein n=1 Tax=Caenorhabditis remanei TaxID=31234 RepID=E3N2Z5_CAERE|nr:hypothetical protein CRE_19887 [Caenorhabditis remanei]
MSSSIRVFLFLYSLYSLTSATGHLRLELTASTNCNLRLLTDSSDETLQLLIGEKRITSFHPRGLIRDNIRVGFSIPNGKTTVFEFSMKNSGQPQLPNVFEDAGVVVLIQSIYECNRGFHGLTCEFVGTSTTPGISSTTTTTTTTTVTTTTEMKKETPELTTSTISLPIKSSGDYDNTIIIILIILIATLTILIIVFGTLLITSSRSSQEHIIYPGIAMKKVENSKKCKTLLEEGIYEEVGEEARYTAAPFKASDL